MGGGLESRCVGRVYGADGALQDHHPSKNSVQKTICCNSTPNSPDDGRMRPKHVELRIHQHNYLVASSWHFTLFHEEDARSNNPQVYTIQCSAAKYSDVGACRIYSVTLSQQIKFSLILSQDCSLIPSCRLEKPQY